MIAIYKCNIFITKATVLFSLQSEDLWRTVAEQRQQICASHFSHPGVKAIRPFPSSH
jgi:hypothetical protein